MKFSYLFLGLFIILIIALVKVDYFNNRPPNAEINGHVFSLYLAKTSHDREVGLAKFNRITKNQAMLFIFPKLDYYSFWMKNMKFPIDIIFIKDNRIVDIFQNVPVPKDNNNLPTYTTGEKADKVLEINSGLSNAYKITIGDEVKLNL
jgi:uncharacterized membrane protein (UPF0127 family)